MSSNIFMWAILVIIGVSDAKSHRIPNKLLVLLLALLCLKMVTQVSQELLLSVFLDRSLAFGIAFVFALSSYLLRVMAPGDVKLIAVLGFFLGTGELTGYLYYVCLITVFVGFMYWLLNKLHLSLYRAANTEAERQSAQISFIGIAVSIQLSQQYLERKITTEQELTYMPFAPILVMGLALHQYYT